MTATPTHPRPGQTRADHIKETAAAASAKDDALAASLKAERTADRLARTKRLSGLAHRPAKTTYVLRRIGLTPEEWARLEYVGQRLVTGLKPSQKPSKSVIVAAMLSRLC